MDMTLEVPLAGPSIEDVYRAHAQRLWNSIRAYAGDASIADDAVAEAFAQALGRGDAIRDPERWVWRAAFRIAAGQLKERRRFGEPDPAAGAGTYELDGVSADITDALARLPEGQRAAVVLHYYADLRVSDVARVLGSTTPAVKVALMRARRRLRSLLEMTDG